MPDLPKRPATCSLYACQATPTAPLKAKPPHGAEQGIWWFCRRHAAEAEAKGYAPLRPEAQASLL